MPAPHLCLIGDSLLDVDWEGDVRRVARVDRGCDPVVPPGPCSAATGEARVTADAVLISDYGRGLAALPEVATAVAPGSQRPPTAGAVAESLGTAVALTSGGRGAVLAEPGALAVVVPTRPARGAGDALSVHAALALATGASRLEAVEAGVACARAYVAGRAPGVSPLEHARSLGDHLVVLVKDDTSVRRLKGPGRPLNPVDDHVAVLRSLACVDEVIPSDEDSAAARGA